MKIFQIGFNKCATKSFERFFAQNGYKGLHWEGGNLDKTLYDNIHQGKKPLDGYEDYVFFSDSNFIHRHFELLDALYPSSKFIYNIRPIPDWIRSRQVHAGGKTKRIYKRLFNIQRDKHLHCFWDAEWKLQKIKIEDYFKGKKRNQLLIFDIMKDDGSTLVNFLPELEFKNIEFPHNHKTKGISR